MTLDQIKEQVQDMFNKTAGGGTLPARLFNSAMRFAVEMFTRKECGLEENENPNGPYYQKTRQVTDAVAPLMITLGENGNPYLLIASNGYAEYPEDFFLFSSQSYVKMTNTTSGSQIEEKEIVDMTDEQFTNRLRSVRKAPTLERPISTTRNGKLRYAPEGLKRAKFTYLRKPVYPIWDFTIVGNNQVYLPPGGVHDGSNLSVGTPSNSVEVEFHDKYHQDIANYAYNYLARNLKRPEAVQLSDKQKATGE